jgi:ubiquinone biosynthesis protein UbiJ
VRINRRASNPDGSKVEKRSSHRFTVMIPVEVSWRGSDGKAVKADAVARQVNARGGFLEMESLPEFGSRISLTNFLSAQTVEARVLGTPETRTGIAGGVAVELVVPSEDFWGVDLQAKKAAVELRKLETALSSQGVDLRLLSEFRDAVEYIRGVATFAQQLRETQLRGRDENELHTEIAGERVRRAAKLCREVAADLDSALSNLDPLNTNPANVAISANDLDELRQALAQVSDRLKRIQSLPDSAQVTRPVEHGSKPARALVTWS